MKWINLAERQPEALYEVMMRHTGDKTPRPWFPIKIMWESNPDMDVTMFEWLDESEEYIHQDDVWESRRWNRDKTDYIDLSGDEESMKHMYNQDQVNFLLTERNQSLLQKVEALPRYNPEHNPYTSYMVNDTEGDYLNREDVLNLLK